MRFVYATDLHGNQNAIEAVFRLAQKEQADAIVFGGDLTPKSVAIKLAQHPDYSEEENYEINDEDLPLIDGEVIPTDSLEQSLKSNSYLESLQAIKTFNERIGSAILARHLERQGYILYELTNKFYEFETLMMEQIILEKLYAFFKSAEPVGKPAQLQLSEMELDILGDCVVDWLKQEEETWTEAMRDAFTHKCSLALGSKIKNFSEWAPSQYLLECILFELYQGQMTKITHGVEKVLLEHKSPLAKHILQSFKDTNTRLFRAHAYKTILEETHIASLAKHSNIAQLKNKAEDPAHLKQAQQKFFQKFFLPLTKQWRAANNNKPVYAMLGNDDLIENASLLEEAEREGIIYYLHGKIHKLDENFAIVGYSFVESLPPKILYRAWEKKSKEILAELRVLQNQLGEQKAVWVIHNPPYEVLDQVNGQKHAGSQGIMQFILEAQPQIALFGHIHEAPRLYGANVTLLGNTLCINPGGEHIHSLQTVLINTETLEIEVKGGEKYDGT
ncbi:MAG: metallophosphoesterase [Patescibacteria group bacterium]